jgi:hypothetical protein
MKKSLHFMPLIAVALLFALSAAAQQKAPSTEDVAYELPALISFKTIPMFDQAFQNMEGVKVAMYCPGLNLVVFTVDRSKAKDNTAIEQKIHSLFNSDQSTLPLEAKTAVRAANYEVMCNEKDLIKR